MSAWKCSRCDAENDEGFRCCWQCGASTDGVADPSFVREVDAATLPPDWVPRIKCESCGYTGKVLVRHLGYQWWTLPLAIVLSCTVIGVIPWLVLFLLLGNRTFRACPNCDARDRLTDWDGANEDPAPESEQIWKEKHDADKQAFKTNKLTLLAVVSIVFVVAMMMLLAEIFIR